MEVIKRNGEKVPFDFEKIKKAVVGAFKEVGQIVPESIFENCESLLQIGFVHMQFFLSLDVFRLGCLVYRPTAGRAC